MAETEEVEEALEEEEGRRGPDRGRRFEAGFKEEVEMDEVEEEEEEDEKEEEQGRSA